MSVIVGLKSGGKVYLGADTQLTKGTGKFTSTNYNNLKIWAVEGVPNCIMGYVGTTGNAQMIRAFPPEIDESVLLKDTLDWTYVVRNILPHIYNVLKETGRIAKDSVDIGIELFFAFRDRLYAIEQDGTVLEVDDYFAIGCGEGEALGTLASTEHIKNPEKRIVAAIQAAIKTNAYVDYPIVLTDTEKCGIKIYSNQPTA